MRLICFASQWTHVGCGLASTDAGSIGSHLSLTARCSKSLTRRRRRRRIDRDTSSTPCSLCLALSLTNSTNCHDFTTTHDHLS